MAYDPARHHRRSIRLPDYDYAAPGWYFVTVCVQHRACLFGEVTEDRVRLSEAGRIVQAAWDDLPTHYPHVCLDAFVVMPNHVHGIIGMTDANDPANGPTDGVGAGFKPAPTGGTRHGLPEIVRALKTFSSRRINRLRGTPGARTWQRNYWERVIRTGRELDLTRRYIAENPLRWHLDRLHAARRTW